MGGGVTEGTTGGPLAAGRWQEPPEDDRRPGRGLAVFKALAILVLVTIISYGMLRSGLFGEERWLPVAIGVLTLAFFTMFVRGFYDDVPFVGWALVGLLGALVGIKGLSMLWTISSTETIEEVVRSSMYLATFAVALAALAAGRQVGPLMDVAILIVTAVAGYGILQKISPDNFPPTTTDAARVGSTLQYANTAAAVVGMGLVLVLGRMTAIRSPLARGLYAALLVLFGVMLWFTFSRGGLLSTGVGLFVLFFLGGDRLQSFTNLLLASAPIAWVLYRVRDLGALSAREATDVQRLEAGMTLRNELILALVVAFLLQAAYAAVAARYELLPEARRVLAVAALAVVVLAAGVGSFTFGGEFLPGGEEEVGGRLEEGQDASQRITSVSANSRDRYWQVAWQEWVESPSTFLTGTGAGTFMYTWLQDRPGFGGVKQVHNVYLEQGTETGIFAFLAIMGFSGLLAGYLAWTTWSSRALGERRVQLSALTAAAAVYLFSSIFEWHWYIPPSTLFFFFLAAVAVKYAAEKDREPPEKSV